MGYQQTSAWFSFFCLFIACAINVTVALLPMWLYNEPFGSYSSPRRWGLFYVVGKERRSHKRTYESACSTAAELAGLGACMVGACPHFRDRCHAWRMLMTVSYVQGSILFFSTSAFVLACIIGIRQRIKTLKLTVVSTLAGVVTQIGGLVAYFFTARTVFAIVNTHGVYPVPNPNVCFYMAMGSALLAFFALCSQIGAYRKRNREAAFTEDVRQQVREVRDMYGFN